MQLQICFDKVQEIKQAIRQHRAFYKSELASNHEYTKTAEELKTLTAYKKKIERETQEGMPKVFDEITSLKSSLKTDTENLAMTSLSDYAAGKTVEVKKQVRGRKGKMQEITLVPKFSVKFQKE